MRTYYGNLKAAFFMLALATSAQADDYIPSIFLGGWASEDSSLQAIVAQENSIRIFYEGGGSATCVPMSITTHTPGIFRSSHGASLDCRGVDMPRLQNYNNAFKVRIEPKDVQWSIHLSEVERGFEIEVMSCLSPLDDERCPKATMYKAN